jgi:NitT/TauT family transport system substrate-binding protein
MITAAAAALTVAACGSSAGSTASAANSKGLEHPDIVVAGVPGEGAAGMYVALQEGLFAKAGLHVKWTPFPSSSASDIPGLMKSGKIDVDEGAYTTFIALTAANIDKMRIVAPGLALSPHIQEVIVPPNSPIKSLGQLKGKTIAINALASISSDELYTALASYGITPAEVHLTVFPFPAIPEALATHQADAAFEVEPYITQAIKEHGDQELADIDSGPLLNFPVAGYGVFSSFAAKYPRTVAAFAKVIDEGNAIASTNLAEFQKAIGGQLKLPPSITGVISVGTFPTKLDPTQIQRVANLMLTYGQLKTPFTVNSSIIGP